MKILNFGSLNLDIVYSVDHIVMAGETISSEKAETHCGGKGLNQSISLAKAGAKVYHAGLIGEDGGILAETLDKHGVDTTLLRKISGKTGHAIIQVDQKGQNCILLYGGTNRRIDRTYVDEVLEKFDEGDFLLLQNEISELPYLILKGAEKRMRIILNPSPYNAWLDECDLSKVELFLMNEIEGAQMTGETLPDHILGRTKELYPKARIVLTLGEDGAIYDNGKKVFRQGVFPVKPVDTTAAGDTFTGYFIAAYMQGKEKWALREASAAAALAVTVHGAATSIPERNDVKQMILNEGTAVCTL